MGLDEIKKRFYQKSSGLSQIVNELDELQEHTRKLQEFAQRTAFTLQELQ